MKKSILLLLVFLGLSSAAYCQYPVNTVPSYNDTQKTSTDKIVALLNDAKTGAAPLKVTAGTATPATMTLTSAAATSTGTVATGAHYIQFVMSNDFSGTINGVAYVAGSGQYFPPVQGYLYPAVPYTISAGTLTITVAK